MSRPGVNESSEWNFIKVILTKDQEKSKGNKEGMRIRKSRCIRSDGICTGKFNTALSLCGVLRVTFYFSKDFLEVVAKALWLLGVTMICFLGQESSLWSPTPQQRHRLFLRCFLCLSLVNLLLLASLEERFICRELDCFLEAVDKDDFEEEVLADEATGDEFALI